MPAALENRFINVNGDSARGRRSPSTHFSVTGQSDIGALVDAVRILSNRVSELEASRPQPWIEFEVDCPAADTVTVEHGFKCPVRWYVTHWDGAAPPDLTFDSVTDTSLVLTSASAGRAVIRVEKSQFPLTES